VANFGGGLNGGLNGVGGAIPQDAQMLRGVQGEFMHPGMVNGGQYMAGMPQYAGQYAGQYGEYMNAGRYMRGGMPHYGYGYPSMSGMPHSYGGYGMHGAPMMDQAAYLRSGMPPGQSMAYGTRTYGAMDLTGGMANPTGSVGIGARLAPFLNFKSLLKTTGISALFSFPIAALQNFLDMRSGNKTGKQFLADTLADGTAYTVAGTAGTVIGGVVGSIVPFAGTAIGMVVGAAVGMGLSWLYDKFLKKSADSAVEGLIK